MAILILTSCVFLLLFTAMFIYKLLAKSTIAPPREIQNAINSDPDFEISEGVLIKYNGTAAVVVIPEGVTRIGDRAFYQCTDVTSITIGNSVTSIGEYAFNGCTDVTSITIGNSVTSIGWCAFYHCTGLTEITIPDSVTSIGGRAFDGCTGLTSITIGNSVTSIGFCTFDGCTGLTSITIGNSVTSIGAYAFSYCTGLTEITIPDSVTSIGAYAFNCCTGLTSITIGNSVTSIGDQAFRYCTGLTSMTIGNSVMSIGHLAFKDCTGLTSVTIGNSVTSIDESAFEGCTNLRRISVPGHFSDQQILDLRLPLECIIERRELAILPVVRCDLAEYLNQNFNLVDAAIIKRFKRGVFYSTRLAIQGKLPSLPADVWGVVLDQLRTVYLPSSEITKDILADTPDSQERKDKVAAYEQEVRPLLTQSPEQGG